MKMNLNELEIRVLGSLMEKELTTPENYPLSLNALVGACNQKSNRDPIMSLTEADVVRGLEGLGSRGLARLTTTGGRVAKYCHSVEGKLGLAPATRAVLVELMLRGPQTVGELRNRADRMATFADLAAVEAVLMELRQYGPPLVTRMPRQPGRKDQRYVQLFAGMQEFPEEESAGEEEVPRERRAAAEGRAVAEGRGSVPAGASQRLRQLEEEVGVLREDVSALRREIEELLSSFG